MSTPTNPIELLDVPLPVVEAAARITALKAKAAREGLLAEQRHQLLDLDPDSAFTLPGSCCVNCPPKGAS